MTNKKKPEDYSRSRSFATIDHLGRRFHIVRRRFDGKPWRKYLTLTFRGVAMTNDFPRVEDPSNIEQVTKFYHEQLARLFPDSGTGRRCLDEGIATIMGDRNYFYKPPNGADH